MSTRVRCSRCGKSVSNEITTVIGELYVRAWVECPECLSAKQIMSVPLADVKHALLAAVGYIGGMSVLDEEAIKQLLVETYKALRAERTTRS